MAKWTSREATDELNSHGMALLNQARAWLEKHEPEYLASSPQAVTAAAMQALANAEADRMADAEPGTSGQCWVDALAHQVALLLLQQNRPPAEAYRDFSSFVGLKMRELVDDGASEHMVGAGLETKGAG